MSNGHSSYSTVMQINNKTLGENVFNKDCIPRMRSNKCHISASLFVYTVLQFYNDIRSQRWNSTLLLTVYMVLALGPITVSWGLVRDLHQLHVMVCQSSDQ